MKLKELLEQIKKLVDNKEIDLDKKILIADFSKSIASVTDDITSLCSNNGYLQININSKVEAKNE